jgi:two-component system sensor histidine kinase RpfC
MPDAAPSLSTVRYNVLIVDDNDTNRYLLKEVIEQLGHQVVTASSGYGALDVLASDAKIDLLFLDYNLGDIDGATVLQLYRFGRTELTPVFFLTADASQFTAERLQNSGARGVLTKPVRTEELRRAIASVSGPPESAIETTQAPAPSSPLSEPTAERWRPRAVPVVYLDAATIESLRNIGSRPSFISELLTRANADISDNCNRITNGLAAHDTLAVREAAHALKGVCLEVGATRLLNLALALMRYDDSQLTSQMPKLKAELTSAREGTSAALRSVTLTPAPLESTAGRTAA